MLGPPTQSDAVRTKLSEAYHELRLAELQLIEPRANLAWSRVIYKLLCREMFGRVWMKMQLYRAKKLTNFMQWLYDVNVDRHAEALEMTIELEIRLQDIMDDLCSDGDDEVTDSSESEVDEPQVPVEGWSFHVEEDHVIGTQEPGMGLLCRRINLCVADRR